MSDILKEINLTSNAWALENFAHKVGIKVSSDAIMGVRALIENVKAEKFKGDAVVDGKTLLETLDKDIMTWLLTEFCGKGADMVDEMFYKFVKDSVVSVEGFNEDIKQRILEDLDEA